MNGDNLTPWQMGEGQHSLPDGVSVSSGILFLIKFSIPPTFVKALCPSLGTSFGELVIEHEGYYFWVEGAATPTLKYALFRHHFVSQIPSLFHQNQ